MIFVIFDYRAQGDIMKLSLNIILDELSDYHPITRKSSENHNSFKQFHYYNSKTTTINPDCLYVIDMADFDSAKIRPKNIIVLGEDLNEHCLRTADTVIQIPVHISVNDVLQTGLDIFSSYEAWDRSMLLSIINHSPLNKFLEIAAQKLTNPISVFDNSLTMMAKGGNFTNSPKGTIWEYLESTNFAVTDFFPLQEYRDISLRILNKPGKPYVYHPSIDKDHAYIASFIGINDKPYGSVGMVDINAPFTEGQLSIISHITTILKLYFQNNDIYLRMAENRLNYIESLLEGKNISEEIVSYYLKKIDWKLDDGFYFISFDCPVQFSSSLESLSHVKLIGKLFPKSNISIYQNRIVMIIRTIDYLIDHGKEKQRLEQFLADNNMYCGISSAFNDFMNIQYYHIQSWFALEYCRTNAGKFLCCYDECYTKHILKSLAKANDLRCFCHPKILSLWTSGNEGNHELVRSLYYYLLNGRNIASTAESLHVHRNSFIYRLNKLSEILDADLKNINQDKMFFYLFSCMIVQQL
jgi:hypothetical protein